MLFEVAVAAAEQLLEGGEVDWDIGLQVAIGRQRKHFDAQLPSSLTAADTAAALWVANNLVATLNQVQKEANGDVLIRSPRIPGYQWIASGVGDFAVGTRLIEVKCTNRIFSTSDYRQIVMYWLLSYASSLESGAPEWSWGILVNPRLNQILKLRFDDVISIIGAGRSKVELVELFSHLVVGRAE